MAVSGISLFITYFTGLLLKIPGFILKSIFLSAAETDALIDRTLLCMVRLI